MFELINCINSFLLILVQGYCQSFTLCLPSNVQMPLPVSLNQTTMTKTPLFISDAVPNRLM